MYQEFKESFPDHKNSFIIFVELKPKHCFLAGASGTHAVCVLTKHKNLNLGSLVKEMHMPELLMYHDDLLKIMCHPPHPRR